MLKYLDPCDGKVSENWRKSWLSNPQHRFTGEWSGKVCNLFLFHYCNGTHCVCGNKDIFGVDLKYASMKGSKQTCFAKDMEPCSHHTADFARDLRLNARDKKRAIIRQYFVPSSAWGGNCTAKVNLDCADDMHWCKAVKDKTKKRVFYTRCILKEYPSSGQDRLQLIYETLFVLKSIVIGMNYYHLL
ncbi:unnamed protein product [Orchesella dallaii]|uniref:Uncharacterized protein n=1 Tax=Orchesella dallaii TaxID=48710 RepID=A0ABP1RBF7_9HEXA